MTLIRAADRKSGVKVHSFPAGGTYTTIGGDVRIAVTRLTALCGIVLGRHAALAVEPPGGEWTDRCRTCERIRVSIVDLLL